MTRVVIKRKFFEVEIFVEDGVNEQGNLPIEILVTCIKNISPLQVGDFTDGGSMNFFLSSGVFLDDAETPCVKNIGDLITLLIFYNEDSLTRFFVEDAVEGAWHNEFPREES